MTRFETAQPILLIIGMHRSGTSLVASMLQSAGLDIGKTLMEGAESNQKGHFENLDFVDFHQKVLDSLGIHQAGWTLANDLVVPDYFVEEAKRLIQVNASSSQPWGWKEPRTTLFLDFWTQLLPDAKFLLVYRNPWEVTDSLFRRFARQNLEGPTFDQPFYYNPEFALQVWSNYNQIMLDFYLRRPNDCFLTSLEAITTDPARFIEALQHKLNLPLGTPDPSLYEESLLHRQTTHSHHPALIAQYYPEAIDLYATLDAKADLANPVAPVLEDAPLARTWIFRDWIDLRTAETQSKHEARLHKRLSQEYQAVLDDRQRVIEAKEQVAQALEQVQAEFRSYHAKMQQEHQQWSMQLAQIGPLQEQLRQAQIDQEVLRFRVEHLQKQVAETQSELEQSRRQAKKARHEVEAMKTSKFWKIRSQWFKVKRLFGLKGE